jgi:hypothetical protein
MRGRLTAPCFGILDGSLLDFFLWIFWAGGIHFDGLEGFGRVQEVLSIAIGISIGPIAVLESWDSSNIW